MSDLHSDNDKSAHRYQLRHAAGLYWLIDMKQSGDTYISPVPLNEVGAKIWEMFESGMSEAEICGWLSDEYKISPEQAQSDVRDFVTQLEAQKVIFGGAQ